MEAGYDTEDQLAKVFVTQNGSGTKGFSHGYVAMVMDATAPGYVPAMIAKFHWQRVLFIEH